MEIAYSTHAGGMDTTQGYGVAGEQIIKALNALGHSTPFQNADSPVCFQFTQPYYYTFNPNQYNIGYTPWESTKLHDGWVDAMNKMDEVWTTSDWCANVFEDEGVTAPIYIYEHGVDTDLWRPKLHEIDECDGVVFLHVGEPAPRKGGQIALDAYTELFNEGKVPQSTMRFKSNGYSTLRGKLPDGSICRLDEVPGLSIQIRNTVDTPSDYTFLFHTSQALVYPSWGEGFGLIPLEAMATGQPVIMTTTWAPYRDLCVLPVEDQLVDSPWQNTHPGQVLKPNKDSVKAQMVELYNNLDEYAQAAFDNTPAIHERYNWNKLTEDAFAHVVEQFE